MIFSFSTLFSMLVVNAVFVGILHILINTRFINYRNINFFLLSTAVVLVKFLLPYEFPFTKSIAIRKGLPVIFDVFHTALFTVRGYSIDLFRIFVFFWISGSIFLSVKAIKEYRKILENLAVYEPLEDFPAVSILQEVNTSYCHPERIKLFLTDRPVSPITFGLRSPTIIVPNMSFSDREWRYILSHETAHYYSHHLNYKLLCTVLRILYFWNPLTNLLIHQINRILEISIDSKITSGLTEREKIEYSECLLKVARQKETARSGPIYTAAFISGMPLSISQRIYLIMESPGKTRKLSFKVIAACCIMITLLIFSLFFVFEAYRIRTDDATGTYDLPQSTTYFIMNADGTYDLYFDSEYVTTVTEIWDDTIPIYKIPPD